MELGAGETRYRIDDHGSQFIITIPRKWSWGIFAIEPAIAAIIYFFFPAWREDFSRSKIVLAIGVLAALGFLRDWLWNLGGQEMVVIEDGCMILRRELFGLSWSKSFKLSDVSDLQYVEAKGGGEGEGGRASGIGFDYHQRPRRFGDHLSEPEANALLEIIRNRFPELCRSTPEPKHFITLDI